MITRVSEIKHVKIEPLENFPLHDNVKSTKVLEYIHPPQTQTHTHQGSTLDTFVVTP